MMGVIMIKMMKNIPKMIEKCMGEMNPEDKEKMIEMMREKMVNCSSDMSTGQKEGMISLCGEMFNQAKHV